MSEREAEQANSAPGDGPAAQEPAWRSHFPIDTPEEHYHARREFTKFLGLTSLAFVFGQFWIAVRDWLSRRDPATLPRKLIGLEADIRREIERSGAFVFHYPEEEHACLALLHPDGNTLIAYDQQCTHLSCAVVPDKQHDCLLCPCHHGRFDVATGRPIAGPPRRPLPRIRLEIVADRVFAANLEARTV